MFLFVIVAKPKSSNDDFNKFKGAYVKVYINFKDELGAEILARHYIDDVGWEFEKIDKVSWLTKKEAKKEELAFKSFLMAKENGRSLVFHAWSKDPKLKH
jgi:hypothetical protein